MKKTLIIALVAICGFVSSIFSQKLNEPKLVGSWIGGEDFGEFIFHATAELKGDLEENPNGKIVARICSKHKMSVALATSNGFAFQFLKETRNQTIPDYNVYLARSSKCGEKREQYWFVPENTTLDYDEIILAERVKVNRLLGDYYDNPNSLEAKKEFADNTKQFIEELKNNSKAEGFIIRNIKTKNRYFEQALKQIQKEKIDKTRFQIVRKKVYQSNFPEFMIVLIREQN